MLEHPSPSVLIPALHTVGNIVTGDDMQTQLELLSFFLIELSLVEHEMLKFPPSLLAASAIYTAQCTIYGFKEWNRTCEWHSNYSERAAPVSFFKFSVKFLSNEH
ncbi:hypothetical protein OIU78_028598 [Salix suchowensis]|nr:hypothetical protein OIU78_028598 [Salix suchowensis]